MLRGALAAILATALAAPLPAPAGAQQQAPLTLGGGASGGAAPPAAPVGVVEPNNAVSFRAAGEIPMPLDTVTSQRLAVVMEYLRADGVRDTLGSITAWEASDGTHFKIVVTGFAPGFKGFHLLSHGDCDPVARNGRLELGGAAGSLYNPTGVNQHQGPFGGGYLGALPKAEANGNGWIFMTLVATRVHLADLRGRALVLREDDDNYKASPPLGGSGGVAACGLVR